MSERKPGSIIVDVRNPVWEDLTTVHTKRLTALVFHLRKNKARDWRDLNGDDAMLEVCRELRTRDIGRHTLVALVDLDPPPCACGRVGLYRIGVRTFCRSCKPTTDAGAQWRSQFYSEQSADIHDRIARSDAQAKMIAGRRRNRPNAEHR